MAITYPLSLPLANFKRFNLRASVAVGQTRSPFTGQTQVYGFQNELWIADAAFPVMQRADAEAWGCFLLKLRGPYGTFAMGDPAAKTARGFVSGIPKVNGAATQFGTTLATKGWTPSITNILRAGDFIQISTALYKNLSDANSDGSGNVTLDIFPILRESYADNTTIITSEAKGLWRLVQSDYPIYGISEDKLYEVAFTAVEAI